VGDFAKGFFEGICWNGWVKTTEGIMEAASEENILEGLTLGSGLAGGDVWAKEVGVAE
jgi:hypothetical protein